MNKIVYVQWQMNVHTPLQGSSEIEWTLHAFLPHIWHSNRLDWQRVWFDWQEINCEGFQLVQPKISFIHYKHHNVIIPTFVSHVTYFSISFPSTTLAIKVQQCLRTHTQSLHQASTVELGQCVCVCVQMAHVCRQAHWFVSRANL